MAGETNITITGNLAEDPKPFVSAQGVAISNLVVLSTPQHFDKQQQKFVDGVTNRFEVQGFRDLAQHANLSLKKGMRVTVTGRIETQTWVDTATGGNRSKQVITAEDIAISLRFGTAAFQKSAPAQQNAHPAAQVAQQSQPQAPAQPVNQMQQAPQQQVAQPQMQQAPQQAPQPQMQQAPQGQNPTPQPGELDF